MKDIVVFCEDTGHEEVITPLVARISEEFDIDIDVQVVSSTGGHGQTLIELREYVEDLRSFAGLPDLIIVGRDSNCRGVAATQDELNDCLDEYSDFSIYALPNPHIERWLLVDSSAFKRVLGEGCDAPDEKCDKARYKKTLAEAVREAADVNPSLGGIEYAQDIVAEMDLDRMTTADRSLGSFISNLRQQFRQWSLEE
jgi:hypothetical protein